MWSVISDLHLFTARSVTHRFMDGIVQAMDESEALVLNGDILDFNWSVAGDTADTMAAGESWLRELAETCPSCRIVYLLGNHDGLAEWARRCETLARELPSLEFSPDYYRAGNTLFTHGDLLMGPIAFRTRALPEKISQKRAWQGALYREVSKSSVASLATHYHGRRRYARRLARNLDSLDTTLSRGVTQLCVGHTHLPFTNLSVEGLTVFNSGSTVCGMTFNLLRLEVTPSGTAAA